MGSGFFCFSATSVFGGGSGLAVLVAASFFGGAARVLSGTVSSGLPVAASGLNSSG